MLKPEGSESKLKLWQRLGAVPAFCLLVVLVSTTMASAQCTQGTTEFTLCAATPSPQAIVPGGTSSTSITIGSVNGFTGTVNLACAVTPATPTQTVTDAPVCTVSPPSVTPPAMATATITSKSDTTTIGYDVTITGTGPTTTYATPPLGLTVTQCTQGTTEFSLCAANLSPPAIVPGGTSSTSIMIGGASGTETINLGCTVTASQMVTDAPVCTVSPPSVTLTPNATATATATITSQRSTTTIGYDVTITGTGTTTTYTTPPLGLTVLAVTPQFTIAIQTAMSPNSVPAGNASQGVISVTPVNGYSTPSGGGITLYCSSITPLVTIPPVCSFAYSNGKNLSLVDSPQSVTLTIKTAGTTVIAAAPHSRSFYALWLSIPVLGLVGVGTAVGGKRSGKALGVLSILLVCGCLLLLPACVNQLSNGTVGTPNGITPANTYTFTIVGVDSDGVVSSNTGTSTGPTMTLTVTAPPKT